MTYTVSWSEAALNSSAGFLHDDLESVRAVFTAVDRLTGQPRPDSSTALGSANLRRLHLGRYRIVYEIDELGSSIVVVHVGRVG